MMRLNRQKEDPIMKRFIALTLALIVCMAAIPAFADVYEDAGFIKKIPITKKYRQEAEHKGTVEKITYTCPSYAEQAVSGVEKIVEKDLYVYLPYGYSPDQEYNVLYLMHGRGEDERYWLNEERMGAQTCMVLDNMVENGEMEPTIVVAPTSNLGREPGTEPVYMEENVLVTQAQGGDVPDTLLTQSSSVGFFWQELRYDIIPMIETRYSTFTEGDVSEENLKATREHRAIAGFSMGSGTTRSVMMHNLDIIAYFGNYSGGSDGKDFFDAMASEEFKDLPIKFWYHGEGTDDFALEGHLQFCASILEKMSDRVTDGVNYAYIELKNGAHAYTCWQVHLYNCLKVFFQ